MTRRSPGTSPGPDDIRGHASTPDEPDALDLATLYFFRAAMDARLVDAVPDPLARWASIDSLIEAGGRDLEQLTVAHWIYLAMGLEVVGEVAA